MKNILFLDFDGPLFSDRSMLLPENRKLDPNIAKKLNLHPFYTYWKMDPIAVSMINNLFDIFQYEIVVSSSWADDSMYNKENIIDLFNLNSIHAPLHQDWRTPRHNSHKRANQISDWLSVNNIDYYVILDDMQSGFDLFDKTNVKNLNIIYNNIILVDIEDGISFKNYKKMLTLFK